MNVVSAYLIRQVATDSTEEFKKSHLGKLKTAVTSGRYNEFVETLYLKLIPDGQVDLTGSDGTRTRYNPYVAGKLGEGWRYNDVAHAQAYHKGASWVVGGRDGLKACLRYWYGPDPPVSDCRCIHYSSPTAGICQIQAYIGEDGEPGALYVYMEDYQTTSGQYTNYYHKLFASSSIPIFTSYQAAQSYESLVDIYINSKLDSDLDNISDLMDADLFGFDYDF